MFHHIDYVPSGSTGAPLSGVTVRAYLSSDGTLADIYADESLTPFDPVNEAITDDTGMFEFWIEDGVYDLTFSIGAASIRTIPSVALANSAFLASDLASTASAKGAGLSGFSYSSTYDAGTVGKVLQRVAYITEEPYNADPTGVADCAAAFSAAFAAEADIFVPSGTYKLSSCPTPPTGSVHLHGAGPNSAVLSIAHGGTRSLHFTPASENNRVEIDNLTLAAAYASGPCPIGIDVEFPSSTSYPYTQLIIDNIQFVTNLGVTTAPWATTWARGIRIKNVWYPSITRVDGSSYPDAGNTGATGFLEVIGGNYACIAPVIDNVSWYYGAAGILGSAYIEGLNLSNFEFVGVTRGVYVPSSTPVGGSATTYRAQAIWLRDGHIAAHTACVALDTVVDFTSSQNNMQRWADASATNWTGYVLSSVNYPQVQGGTIAGNEASGGITSLGINATGATSSHGLVQGVHFENLDTQFIIGNLTTFWTFKGNRSTGATSDVYTIDAGSSKYDIAWLNADGTITYKNDQLSGPIMAGQYTPTLTSVANVDSTSAYLSRYYRVGNMVTVWGKMDVDPTASTTLTRVGISLPVASNLTAAQQLSGAAGSIDQGTGGGVTGDATNDRGELSFKSDTNTSHAWTYSFSYEVV